MAEAGTARSSGLFREVASASASAIAADLVALFERVRPLPDKVQWVQRHIAQDLGASVDAGLAHACATIASTIDANASVFDQQPYHNRQHFCEVALTAYILCLLKQVEVGHTQLLLLAALIHDFGHDGRPHVPFVQERASVERVRPTLKTAGLCTAQLDRLTVLVLATDPAMGSAFMAAACRAHGGALGLVPAVPKDAPELAELIDDAILAELTRTLCEADVLPSVGLTLEHSMHLQARLALEWGRPLGVQDKLRFMDGILAQGFISEFFLPNVQATRAALARAANAHA